jgi:type IV pilus assembly protein PilE
MYYQKNKSGFTIIELLVVIAIIGILAAIAIPGYVGFRLKAERSVAWTDLQSIRLLQEQFYAENSAYAPIGGGNLNGAAAIQVPIPGFQPDQTALTLYNYVINSFGGGTGDQNFTATATRISGNDPGSPWTINDANVSNFQ